MLLIISQNNSVVVADSGFLEKCGCSSLNELGILIENGDITIGSSNIKTKQDNIPCIKKSLVTVFGNFDIYEEIVENTKFSPKEEQSTISTPSSIMDNTVKPKVVSIFEDKDNKDEDKKSVIDILNSIDEVEISSLFKNKKSETTSSIEKEKATDTDDDKKEENLLKDTSEDKKIEKEKETESDLHALKFEKPVKFEEEKDEDELLDDLDTDLPEETESKDELESEDDLDFLLEDEEESKESEVSEDMDLDLDDNELFELADEDENDDIEDDDKSSSLKDLDELDIIPISEDEKEDEDISTDSDTTDNDILDDDIIGLLDEDENSETSLDSIDDENIIPLSEDVSESQSNEEIEDSEDEDIDIDDLENIASENIVIDLDERAKLLEIDEDEYQSLFMDFISDAREMKESLLSDDEESISSTISILKDAVLLLQLEPLADILNNIENTTDSAERNRLINNFYLLLDKIESEIEAGNKRIEIVDSKTSLEEATSAEESAEEEREAFESTSSKAEEKVEERADNTADNRDVQKSVKSNKLTEEEILKDVKPIPIEFSLHIASEELSLPEDLVLEFISDFAQQAHENLPVLIEEYRNDELDKLQKTAHMLKGAASNLRIEQMVDNLYQLQYDNNIENAPERIRKFAGQLMGLDNYLKQMNVK